MDGQIKVGNTSFKLSVLQELTLTECYERFNYIRKDIVKNAHVIAKSKMKPKKRSKK